MPKTVKIYNRIIMIERPEYLKQLQDRIGNDSIKIITGLRRCGKSYLLNVIFYNYLLKQDIKPENIIKFAFDSAEDLDLIGENLIELEKEKRKVDYKKFMKFIAGEITGSDNYFLLLDEVQLLDSFEYVLNSYLNKGNLDIFVTGSNSKFLSSDIITEFRGRGDEIHVMPLSFSEYYGYVSGDKTDAIEQYMIYGGLPRVVLAKSDEQKVKYLESQLEKTYLKDVFDRQKIRQTDEFGELLSILSSGISSLTNPRKLSNTFKSEKHVDLSEITIKTYIDYLKEAFIINTALRYDIKGKKYISTPYKIYFEDIGLRNARLDFRQVEYTHIMENIIYNELRYRGFKVDVGVVEVREKDLRKMLEVDFVANKGSVRYYIQSAYEIPDSTKMEQETKSLGNIKDSFKKILVVEKNVVPYHNDKGYLIIGLRDFLLLPNSLEL